MRDTLQSFGETITKMRTIQIPFILICAIVAAACGGANQEKDVAGGVYLFDRTSAALTTSNIMALEGTYGAACTSRTGTWAIALNGYTLVGGETALTVLLNDTTCVLSITGVKAGAGPTLYQPAAPIVLTAAYATNGVAFMTAGTGPVQFYANFLITPNLLFAANFIVQMVYSDNISETDLGSTATFAVEVATATASVVPAPNGTLNLSALALTVDAHGIVQTATGTATFTPGSVAVASYVIDNTLTAGPSYSSVDAVFRAGTKVSLTGSPQTIPAASFNLVGLNITTAKVINVIVSDIANGIDSYQIFEITFTNA